MNDTDIQDHDGDVAADVPKTVTVSKSNAYAAKDSINDLYSSNRYSWNEEWRADSHESFRDIDEMNVKSWSSAALLAENSRGVTGKSNTKLSSPDAQLIDFLNYNYSSTGNNDLIVRYRGLTNRYVLQRTSLLPTEGASTLPILLGDGTMAYINTNINLDYKDSPAANDTKKPLLGRPIHDLMKHVETLEKRALKRKRKALEEKNDHDDDGDLLHNIHDLDNTSTAWPNDFEDDSRTMVKPTSMNLPIKFITETPCQLWVDKYSPRHFSDLLSDEKINREVLRALREWDPYVFRKSAPIRPTSILSSGNYGYENKGYKKSTTHNIDVTESKKQNSRDTVDEVSTAENVPVLKSRDIRPMLDKRVILLSGPPGIGKTTMAHIIAKHAGYRAVEVNASDERTSTVLKQRVLRAMESGLSKVPNCIILDEIDGADAQATISTLVDIIKEDFPLQTGKGHKPFLRRPIIFICNNKYAPALRPLMAYAQQFEVAPPSSERLISRVRSILSAEHISVGGGSSLLNQLVHATGGDIRSALFSLQFASSRARALHENGLHSKNNDVKRLRSVGTIDISTVLRATLDGNRSLKDDRSDIVATLISIFRKPLQRGDKDVEGIMNLVDSFGDVNKTLDQMFVNVLEVPFVDPMFDRCWAAFEWLSYSDILRSFKTHIAMTNNIEHFSVQKLHIPTTACAVHYLCRIEKRPNLNFSSREMHDASYKTEVHVGLICKFFDGLTPRLQNLFIGTNVVTDLMPYVLWLLSAGVGNSGLNRAVSNVDMLMKSERVTFQRHCDLLRSLGLNYVKVKDDSFDKGRSLDIYRLNPDISDILRFKDSKKESLCHRNEIPSVIKQLLAHSVYLESLRHRGDTIIPSSEVKAGMIVPRDNIAFQATGKSKLQISEIKRESKDGTKTFLGEFAAKSKAAHNAKKAALAGIEKSNTKLQLSNTGSGVPLENVVKFKYQKGFTQAVRMPCSSRDFM